MRSSIGTEKDTIKKMVGLYCHKKHGARKGICRDCQDLLDYAYKRLDNCCFGNDKPTCEKCPVHCYKPDMRGRVKEVMRFSGPRMLFVHPLDAVRHMLKNKLTNR